MNRIAWKALSWETFSGLFCLGLAYLFFGHLSECLVFTALCFVLKLVLFYYHEKLWEGLMFTEQVEEWDDFEGDDEDGFGFDYGYGDSKDDDYESA